MVNIMKSDLTGEIKLKCRDPQKLECGFHLERITEVMSLGRHLKQYLRSLSVEHIKPLISLASDFTAAGHLQ